MFLNTINAPPPASNTLAGSLIARQDRIPTWALSKLFLVILGAGFLFLLYDIFDINVSFIQTCTQIVPGCTPATAGAYLV